MISQNLPPPAKIEEILASIIMLDQFTRNIYRGTCDAFSGDKKALNLALHAVNKKLYLELPPHQRIFLFMPLEHSENLQHQQKAFSRRNVRHQRRTALRQPRTRPSRKTAPKRKTRNHNTHTMLILAKCAPHTVTTKAGVFDSDNLLHVRPPLRGPGHRQTTVNHRPEW